MKMGSSTHPRENGELPTIVEFVVSRLVPYFSAFDQAALHTFCAALSPATPAVPEGTGRRQTRRRMLRCKPCWQQSKQSCSYDETG